MDAAHHLVDVVCSLSRASSLSLVMDIVRHAARALALADGATFVLRESDQVYYAQKEAIAPLWKGQRFPISACISGWAMLHRTAVSVPDVYADTRIPHDLYRTTFVKSLFMVPIRASDPIGAIGTYWATRHEAGEEERSLLIALADSTAVALENVQLIAQLKDARQAAETRETEVRQLYAQAQAEIERRQALEQTLTDKIAELESFYDVVVGRELKMINLEKEVLELRERISACRCESVAS